MKGHTMQLSDAKKEQIDEGVPASETELTRQPQASQPKLAPGIGSNCAYETVQQDGWRGKVPPAKLTACAA
eukprot:3640282-Rhodomonas_salina.1